MAKDQSTILLVEDEPLIRLFLVDLLEEAGFRVIETANAAEALVALESGLRVNVLLTDVDMPAGCDGFELARKVHKSWPETEILIMSGRHWPDPADLPPGAAFLAKPFPNEAIVSQVHYAVARRRRAYS
ncbi:response regulator [Microvirga terricola]|uniref:Response regulator n=1 Tax=Microvirga terricola TaxID=2719797 RepID=A0ABX0VAQ5_9HYPH|nr:response regulator [Microvirga terricola]NIX76146.1 response regulator [Microvirga terricola]